MTSRCYVLEVLTSSYWHQQNVDVKMLTPSCWYQKSLDTIMLILIKCWRHYVDIITNLVGCQSRDMPLLITGQVTARSVRVQSSTDRTTTTTLMWTMVLIQPTMLLWTTLLWEMTLICMRGTIYHLYTKKMVHQLGNIYSSIHLVCETSVGDNYDQ